MPSSALAAATAAPVSTAMSNEFVARIDFPRPACQPDYAPSTAESSSREDRAATCQVLRRVLARPVINKAPKRDNHNAHLQSPPSPRRRDRAGSHGRGEEADRLDECARHGHLRD